MLGISSGEEQEDNSPLASLWPLEKMPDPAQTSDINHLGALGRSWLWHRQKHVFGLGQPGLKMEMLLCDWRLMGYFSQVWDRSKRQGYLNTGKSQLGQSWLLPNDLLQPGLSGRRKAMRNHSPKPTCSGVNDPLSLQ